MALDTTNRQKQHLGKLQKHFDEMKDASMLTMFEADVSRTEKFNLKWNDFLIDYSKYN
jgi:glucose-6-phosphate isomerase